MRHFIVLGFGTTSNSEQGGLVHLGSDRGEAIEIVKAAGDPFVRKQLFELAIPQLSRQFSPEDAEQARQRLEAEYLANEEQNRKELEAEPQTQAVTTPQAPVFSDVPGHDALVAAGVDSFEKLIDTMSDPKWFDGVKGIGESTAVQISEFMEA